MSSLLLVLLAAAGPSVDVVGCSATLTATVQDEYALCGMRPEDVSQVAVRCEAEKVEVVIVAPSGRQWTRVLRLGTDPRAEVRVSVQVVDLVHAALAEERFPGRPTGVLSREPPPRSGPGPTPKWTATLAGGLTLAPGGVGAVPSVSTSVSRAVGVFELGLSARATVRGVPLSVDFGRAILGLFDAVARGAYPSEVGGLTLTPHVSAGVLVVWALGETTSPAWRGRFGLASTFVVGGGLSAGLALSSWLRLSLGVEALAAPFPVRVEVPGATATVGLPVFALELGLSLR